MRDSLLALRCQGLVKRFGGSTALNHVDICLEGAGMVALVGPNGAGKTTLLNVITGFMAPDSGTVFLGSRPIGGLPPWRIARLGVVRTFQEVRLIRGLTALDNVLMAFPDRNGQGLRMAVLPRRSRDGQLLGAAGNLLRSFGLEGLAARPAGALSYGEQKVLALACTFATGAPVLLFDEPVAGVAPELAERIVDRLRSAANDHLIFFVEHNILLARRAASRVLVMDQGRIVAEGPAAEVLERDLFRLYVK